MGHLETVATYAVGTADENVTFMENGGADRSRFPFSGSLPKHLPRRGFKSDDIGPCELNVLSLSPKLSDDQ